MQNRQQNYHSRLSNDAALNNDGPDQIQHLENQERYDNANGNDVDQRNPAYQESTSQANPAFSEATQHVHVPSFVGAGGSMSSRPPGFLEGPARKLQLNDSFAMAKAPRSRLATNTLAPATAQPQPQPQVAFADVPDEVPLYPGGHFAAAGRRNGAGGQDYTPLPTGKHNAADDYDDEGDEYALDDDEDDNTESYDEEDDEALIKPKKKRQPPIVHRWNWIPVLFFIWFLGSSVYFYYVRWGMLTNPYAIVIFSVEILGWTSFMPYALLITRGVYPTGSPGLPPAGSAEADEQAAWWASPSRVTPGKYNDSRSATPMSHYRGGTPGYSAGIMSPAISIPETSYFMYRFHVRVLIPCYKEDLAVVASTVQAALSADLPALTRRTVYVCDDGKDPEKKTFIEGLRLSGEDIVYVSGRIRKKGEVNGKSGNLNNCLKNVIYKNYPKNEDGVVDWTEVSNKECLVVFDADMNCKPDFFLKMLEVMVDDNIALTLSPQAFYNIDTDMDIFNAINAQFWEYWLPGAFGWGYIACTGTNFMIRARALCHAGWFPDYTITEDYALGMELKARGYKATYLCQYIAVGEAPEEARNIFQQRSRWTKGHYQVFFSGINAMLNMQLPFFQRLWYTYAAWAPFCTAVTVPAFMAVPFMSLVFGYNPVSITFEFVLSSTIYFTALQAIQNYCTQWSHLKLMWYVNVSNTVLWFTYVKAFFNTLALKAGMKIATFKATAKTKTIDPNAPPLLAPPPSDPNAPLDAGAAEAALPAADHQRAPSDQHTMVGRIMSNISSRFTPRKKSNNSLLANDFGPKAEKVSNRAGPNDEYPLPVRVGRTTPMKAGMMNTPAGKAWTSDIPSPVKGGAAYSEAGPSGHAAGSAAAAPAPAAIPVPPPPPPPPVHENSVRGWARVKAMAATFKPQNASEFGKMFDPLALLFLWCFNMGTVAVGLWQLTLVANRNTTTTFEFNSPLSGNPYLIISTVWALYNSLSPYLFLHYCFTAGPSFKFMVKWIMFFSSVIMIGSVVIVWMLIPAEFTVGDVVSLAVNNYFPSTVVEDTNTNFVFVSGIEGTPINSVVLNAMLAGSPVPERHLLDIGVPMIDLTGGLLVSDHVKYNMPIAYTISMMAWSYLQFPNGVQPADKDKMLNIMRQGADYLMRCYITMPDGSSVYVAQVGDGADYAILNDPGYDPVRQGKVWTSPQQDAQLRGNVTRKVWLMTAFGIGADLLADVSAALAAVSIVFKDIDSPFALKSLTIAEKVYQFSTVQSDSPHSYCEYVPCQTNVTYTKQVMAREYVPPPPSEPVCYYLDWVDHACYIGMDIATCTAVALNQKEVYTTRSACCNAMTNTGMWNGLASKAQGICAVPEKQFYCYIPDKSQRTCYQFPIDNTTGKGCVGQGIEVFPSDLTCCNYLEVLGAISAENGMEGTGSCSRVFRDPNFTQCYVPVLNNATCLVLNGSACAAYGINSAFDSVAGCCNNIIITMQQLGFNQAGGVQITTSGMCELWFNQQLGGPGRRSLLDGPSSDPGSGARRLQQATTPAASAPSSTITISVGSGGTPPVSSNPAPSLPVDNSSIWVVPPTQAKEQCANNACTMVEVEDQETVAFFNSTSVLDDMAWAAVWMYKATNNALYMGQALKFIARHYTEDITVATMITDRTYYRSDWNNLAWNVNVLLSGITGKDEYKNMAELLLKTWVFGNSVNLDTPLPSATAVVNIDEVTALTNFTDPDSGKTWVIVPQCNPTAKFESNCYDGIDNNCNGLVDRDDIDCGLFPVQYTPNQLAFAGPPSAPLAANAALTALMYAETAPDTTARRLRCWALNQVAYIIGVMPGQPSLVVGYGPGSPQSVQHRASSCPTIFANTTFSNPNMKQARVSLVQNGSMSSTQSSLLQQPAVPTDQPLCNWDNAFYPSTANPQIDMIKGALIWGSLSYYPFASSDQFSSQRTSASTTTTLHDTIGLTAAAMALAHTQTTIRSCELLHGVYQKYTENGVL